jgi:hypothetical protein
MPTTEVDISAIILISVQDTSIIVFYIIIIIIGTVVVVDKSSVTTAQTFSLHILLAQLLLIRYFCENIFYTANIKSVGCNLTIWSPMEFNIITVVNNNNSNNKSIDSD